MLTLEVVGQTFIRYNSPQWRGSRVKDATIERAHMAAHYTREEAGDAADDWVLGTGWVGAGRNKYGHEMGAQPLGLSRDQGKKGCDAMAMVMAMDDDQDAHKSTVLFWLFCFIFSLF